MRQLKGRKRVAFILPQSLAKVTECMPSVMFWGWFCCSFFTEWIGNILWVSSGTRVGWDHKGVRPQRFPAPLFCSTLLPRMMSVCRSPQTLLYLHLFLIPCVVNFPLSSWSDSVSVDWRWPTHMGMNRTPGARVQMETQDICWTRNSFKSS